MTATLDNATIFRTVEFKNWTDRHGLIAEEAALIKQFLDPHLRTLDGGTGGGRILFELRDRGFASLAGFDVVPEMIADARRRDPDGTIDFRVLNVTTLDYVDNSFDRITYLQQVLCLIDGADLRQRAMREAFRVLKPGGIGMFSFLCYEVRRSQPIYAAYMMYLRVLRTLRGSPRSIQYLPWLYLGNALRFGAFTDRSPYVYWYRTAEAVGELTGAGFELIGVGTSKQVREGRVCPSSAEVLAEPINGMLYVVCRKP